MTSFKINYNEGLATADEIREHLLVCSDNFSPPLLTYIDLEEYVSKLAMYSTNIEAWHNGKLIGLIAVYLNNAKSKAAYITNVSVERVYNGNGIASRLLQKVEEIAKANGFSSIVLEVKAENIKAIQFYKKRQYSISRQIDFTLFMEKAL